MRPPMNLLGMWTTAMVLIVFSAASFAETEYKYVENVEELLDNVAYYADKKVQVSGEVEEIDGRAFILESGGVFNDEIVVVISEASMRVMEDTDVTVSGTVRTISFVEVEREYGLDLDPEIEVELENREAFLIADHIKQREVKDDPP